MREPIKSAIVGLGRSGWQNHVRAMTMLPELFQVTSVADFDVNWRSQAEQTLGCRAFPDLESLLAHDESAELVVIATPTAAHRSHVLTALAAGKMVVCEKPIAPTLDDADEIILAAQTAGTLLTVFCNYRFECDFLTISQVLASGVLGDLLTLRITAGRCGRRHDWQTVSRLGGGILRNTGWHLIDQALRLAQVDQQQVQTLSQVARVLSPGDGEDYAKVVIKGDGLPLIDIEVSDVSPFPQDVWQITGTSGSLTGSHQELRWAYVRELAPLAVAEGAAPGREYRFDQIPLLEESWAAPAPRPPAALSYYRSLHRTIRHAAPLAVTLDSVRQVMEVIDSCLFAPAASLGWRLPAAVPTRQLRDHGVARRILSWSAMARYSGSASSRRPSVASRARPGAGSP